MSVRLQRGRARTKRRNCQRATFMRKLLRARSRMGSFKQPAFVAQHFTRAEIASPPCTCVGRAAVEASSANTITEFCCRILCIDNRNVATYGSTRVRHRHRQAICSHGHTASESRRPAHSMINRGKMCTRHSVRNTLMRVIPSVVLVMAYRGRRRMRVIRLSMRRVIRRCGMRMWRRTTTHWRGRNRRSIQRGHRRCRRVG
jgi:hypothetical protein